MPLKIGQKVEVKVTGKGERGDPFGKFKDVIVFLKGTTEEMDIVEGDRILAEITMLRPRSAFANVIKKI